MKALCLYWLVGCIIIGLAIGSHRNLCPNDQPVKSVDTLVAVVIWPAYFAAAIMLNVPKSQCERLP